MSPAEPAAATTLGTDSTLSLKLPPTSREIEFILISGVSGAERQIADGVTYIQRETEPGTELSQVDHSQAVGITSDTSFSSLPEPGDGTTKADAGNNILPGPGAIFYRANVA